MIDRTTKILLGIIALGLWANAIVPLYQPVTAIAQGTGLERVVQTIASDLDSIERGRCRNSKIC